MKNNSKKNKFTITDENGNTTEHTFIEVFDAEALEAIFDEIDAEDEDPADAWKN